MQIVLETICTKCQNLFSGKNKKHISLSSAEYAQSVVKVKAPVTTAADDAFGYIYFFLMFPRNEMSRLFSDK